MKKSIIYVAILMLGGLLFVSCTDLDEDNDLYQNKENTELTTDSGGDDDPPPPPPPPPPSGG
ncbi:hypothetical protein KCTC32516_00586 [Polaribacter huanghezhanensis]|uniref:hypothetical protein n=1 Tax=Polaribacter huanghezhanensis TaxID=1354726 RepID=UPI0026488A86|nr:hypothetical protein [Polaribacter huanghezhanensis]WKD85246.1 hypothetical protein KCTC32516_00586 [Polaribacter huanghezhanensis]